MYFSAHHFCLDEHALCPLDGRETLARSMPQPTGSGRRARNGATAELIDSSIAICVLGAYSLPCAEFNVCIGSKVVNYISKEICAIHGSFAYLLASFIHLNFASLWGRDVLGNLKLDINVGW